jgi:hypothetical protein
LLFRRFALEIDIPGVLKLKGEKENSNPIFFGRIFDFERRLSSQSRQFK